MPRRVVAAVAAVLVLGGAGCAGTTRQVYTPAELREELGGRHAAIPPGELVVPFELPPAALELARQVVRTSQTDAQKVEALVEAMFDPKVFGLGHDDQVTSTGADTLKAGRGNCVGLASVFIGLARSIGLDARYIDASSRVNEIHYGAGGMTVNVGHVTAMVATGPDRIGLDFARMGRITWYRVLDDLEALAHFYNNRGYELLDRERGGAQDWTEAQHQFRLAVAVKPSFARAWNNLGIAAGRLGRRGEAIGHYRRAAQLDPALAAPHANLGAIFLAQSDLPEALEELGAASRLDPRGAHIQYNLAVARLRSGDRRGALEALRRTLSLRGTYPGAQALMEQLSPGSPGAGGE